MYSILILITAYNLFIALRYIRKLEIEMSQENYIYWDHMHSLQHISITWMSIILSIAMLFGVHSDYTMLIYLVYNASLSFIIYPHLIWEK
jgi:hypothetical protein